MGLNLLATNEDEELNDGIRMKYSLGGVDEKYKCKRKAAVAQSVEYTSSSALLLNKFKGV